jgi:sulfur-oxidizing protein SoxY
MSSSSSPRSTAETIVGRRRVMLTVGGLALLASAPALATPSVAEEAIARFTGGRPSPRGRVSLDLPALVDNGNLVAVEVTVASPMTETDHVTAIALFNTANPQPEVAIFHFGPRAGVARVGTRIRLATSQTVIAVAAFADGGFARDEADAIVTLAACLEG